ncbi:hypothetical protein ACWDPV_01255 [Gordonia sp. NPDC003504]
MPQILMIASMAVLLLGHMLKHLGLQLLVSFFAVAAVVEWAFEETNIRNSGFIWGDLRYGDAALLGPHIGSVPVAVPLLMAGILWPTYACVNLLIDGKVVVDPREHSWWENLWRCALYGFVHSWYMFVYNALCEKWELYRWVGHTLDYSEADRFFGDPKAPLGWAIYVVVAMAAFTFVMVPVLGKSALTRARVARLSWVDAAPVVVIGGMGVEMYLNPVNASVGNIALWTLGFFAACVGLKFVEVLRDQRNELPNSDVQRPSPLDTAAH